MAVTLGIDVGTNSVGSAWVDTDDQQVVLGVSVFPAGVDDKQKPRAQARREKRSQRRSVRRRAERKHRLRRDLAHAGLLPSHQLNDPAFKALMRQDPWRLRLEGLARALTPHEFGRALIHLNERRGASFGLDEEEEKEDKERGKVKAGINHLRGQMAERGCKTVGQFMALLGGERTKPLYRDPIRNRLDSFEFHAERSLIQEEFDTLWQAQTGFDSPLARLLTPQLQERIQGTLFFQRKTYWSVSTLGRCDLEPTDRQCDKADRYAQRFLMLETVNRIRVWREGCPPRPLSDAERDAAIAKLSSQKSVTPAALRKAIGLPHTRLNIENEKKPEINTDWFQAVIVGQVFGEPRWSAMDDRQRESVNRALLKIRDEARLRAGAAEWWGLDREAIERLIKALSSRPQGRTRLSRRAIQNLLPHMEAGCDVTTAKQRCGYPPHGFRLNKAARRFLDQHPDQLPPAPEMPNPIVRKALHEVRRHVQEHLRRTGEKPDRIVVELAREVTQPSVVRDRVLRDNRAREKERKAIIETVLKPNNIAESQWRKAIERVLLCRRQKWVCAYTALDTGSAPTITDAQAAKGDDVEVDHIVPRSRSFDNSLHNKVLCLRRANRDKGDQTPREWLTPEQFAALEQRLAHFQKELPRAWENLHRTAEDVEGFVNSQLSDTGYISRQVVAYLQQTLYPGEPHRVLCTKGSYTAILRADWELIRKGQSKRDDHRHHALDAVVIALTDRKRLKALATAAQEQECARAKLGDWPKRRRLDPPWTGFTRQVMALADPLVVAHRPQTRVRGSLHEDSLFGQIPGYDDIFSFRVRAEQLTPPMLAEPVARVDAQGNKTLTVGKGGVVRDPGLRKQLIACLRANGHNPEKFTKEQIKALVKAGKLCMANGVPIRRIRLLRKINRPVLIGMGTAHPRVYVGGNNHHYEIVRDTRTGKWKGRAVSMFEAVSRLHPPAGQPPLPVILGPQAATLREQGRLSEEDARFYQGAEFVMTLCIGEMLRMRDPDTGEPGYFVVKKINPGSIEVVSHIDARASEKRRLMKTAASRIQSLAIEDEGPPCKVRVSPLGQVRPMSG